MLDMEKAFGLLLEDLNEWKTTGEKLNKRWYLRHRLKHGLPVRDDTKRSLLRQAGFKERSVWSRYI